MNRRWEVRLATDADASGLLALYECDSSAGDLAVLTTRRPNPLASLRTEGDRVVFPVVVDGDTGRIIGGGACVVRRSVVGGVPRVVGYLTGLKLLPDYRRQVPLFAQVYGFCREQTRDVEVYYTTIMADNVAAQRLLGRHRRGMPEYGLAGAYTTWCFRAPPWGALPGLLRGYRLVRGSASDLVDTGFDLATSAPPDDAPVWLLRDRSGAVVASAVVWDQRAHRQHIVTGYAGSYRWLRHLPTGWIGYPRLPRPGAVAAQAAVTRLWVRDWDPVLARTFLALLSRAASAGRVARHERVETTNAGRVARNERVETPDAGRVGGEERTAVSRPQEPHHGLDTGPRPSGPTRPTDPPSGPTRQTQTHTAPTAGRVARNERVETTGPQHEPSSLAPHSTSRARMDYLLWGAHESHPLASAMENLRSVRLRSLLYTVHWDDDCAGLTGDHIGIDVALL